MGKMRLPRHEMIKDLMKSALLRARGNVWFRPLGERILQVPGVGPALRGITYNLMPKGNRVWIQVPAGPAEGLWLKVEPYLEARYLAGIPEPAALAAIVKHLMTGGCFYDVGAHIGFYSLLAARLVGEAGRVAAFEPDPANFEPLKENTSRNMFSQIEVIGAAV